MAVKGKDGSNNKGAERKRIIKSIKTITNRSFQINGRNAEIIEEELSEYSEIEDKFYKKIERKNTSKRSVRGKSGINIPKEEKSPLAIIPCVCSAAS